MQIIKSKNKKANYTTLSFFFYLISYSFILTNASQALLQIIIFKFGVAECNNKHFGSRHFFQGSEINS